jgi:DNA-binding beta-propeller fold protein YncE
MLRCRVIATFTFLAAFVLPAAGAPHLDNVVVSLHGAGKVAVDRAGNVFIANPVGNAIDKWHADTGQVETLISLSLQYTAAAAVDEHGDLYIADGNNAIKRWSVATKTLSTLVDGLSAPEAVAVDAFGNVYIADTGHRAVKEWRSATGDVITIATATAHSIAVDRHGNVYFTDEQQLDASSFLGDTLHEWIVATGDVVQLAVLPVRHHGRIPPDIAVDAAGNVYFTHDMNSGDDTIDQWSPSTRQFSTVLAGGLYGPDGIAVDTSGNVYFTDGLGRSLLKLDIPTGKVTNLTGPALTYPEALAVDSSGTVYVAEEYGIKKWDAANRRLTSLVNQGSGSPSGLAVDAAGNLYFGSFIDHILVKWNAATGQVTTLASNVDVSDVALDLVGNVYFVEGWSVERSTLSVWSVATGKVTILVSSGLWMPNGVTVDNAGNVWIADTENGAVKRWSPFDKQLVTVAAGLARPMDVAIGADGDVFIAEADAGAIRVWSHSSHQLSTLISGMSRPISIAIDPLGRIYVTDGGTLNRIAFDRRRTY